MLEKKMQHMMQCGFIARRSCLGWPTDLLVGLKKFFEVQFEPPFFWVGMPQQKEKDTEKVCGPFFG